MKTLNIRAFRAVIPETSPDQELYDRLSDVLRAHNPRVETAVHTLAALIGGVILGANNDQVHEERLWKLALQDLDMTWRGHEG